MLGFLLIVQGRFPEAEQICERALSLSRASDDKRGIVGAASNLGHVRARQGQIAAALTLQREALALAHDLTDVQWVAEMLVDVAGVALTVGDDGIAATLVGVVTRLEETAQFSLAPAYRAWCDEVLSSLHDRIGCAEAERVFADSSHLDQDSVVRLTLDFIDRSLAAIE
jgi:tetratricopeptide (TPR) repeat protein